MRKTSPLRSVLVLASLLAACAPKMTSSQWIAQLGDADPQKRQQAADELRSDAGVPSEAVAPLIAAFKRDTTPNAKGAEAISLGASGAAEAKPLIDDYVRNARTREQQRWAGRALKYWMQRNKQIPQDYKFPDGWPYGTPGYPAIIP